MIVTPVWVRRNSLCHISLSKTHHAVFSTRPDGLTDNVKSIWHEEYFMLIVWIVLPSEYLWDADSPFPDPAIPCQARKSALPCNQPHIALLPYNKLNSENLISTPTPTQTPIPPPSLRTPKLSPCTLATPPYKSTPPSSSPGHHPHNISSAPY